MPIHAGLLALATSAALAAVAAGDRGLLQLVALFLLGYGWNLCLVGGSSRLARDVPAAEQARVAGAVDAAIWGTAAAASMASTAVLAAGGFTALSIAAATLVALPLAVLLRQR